MLHENPYLVLNELIIDDSNHNQIAEPGETIELGVKLMNIGLNPATQVQVSATCEDEFAELINNYTTYGNIQSDSIAVNRIPLSLHIDPNCPMELRLL